LLPKSTIFNQISQTQAPMANFNKVILAGNLTRDPELRYTPKGTAVVKIGMAINRTWKNEAGETKEEVTFVDVDAFGRTAEVIAQYLKKGRPILMEGRLKYDTWDDKQTNQKRSKLGVVMENFQFMDSGRADGGTGGEPSRPRPASAPSSAASAPASIPEPDGPPPEEDDVPF
jgi:single-strand DNA-binding protein